MISKSGRNLPGSIAPAMRKLYGIFPAVTLALFVFSLVTFLPGQSRSGHGGKPETQSNWLETLFTKGSKDISVSPSHPEIKLHVYEDLDPASSHYGVKLCWLLLPRPSVHMAVADIRKSAPANTIYAAVAQTPDVVVSNGGFFGYGPNNSYLPVGLVIANGKLYSRPAKWSSGGAVVQTNGVPTIVSRDELPSLSTVQEAIQSKPMLVEHGRPAIKSDATAPFDRVAVGVDGNGNVIVAGAFQENGAAVNLVEFSAFLSTPRKLGGPEALYALNLDGSTDAHLFFPAVGLHMGYGGPNFVPNAIRFYWK